ncbi:MAG: glycosyl transferase [Saprospiraceae bacterium]|nr:glycosyl transferase [Saprospiraceae bacterium]
MRILYALPLTGNGHISRASSLYIHLSKYGSVDFLVSGNNSQLKTNLPIIYTCKGISLQYKKGQIDFQLFIKSLELSELVQDIRHLKLNDYDLVISDFEPITAWACKFQGKKYLHWGHQASFAYSEVPRPSTFLNIGKIALEKMVRSEFSFGHHFTSFHENISTSVVKEEIYFSDPIAEDIICVYLPQYTIEELYSKLHEVKNIKVHVFHPQVKASISNNNIQFFAVHKKMFDQSLTKCKLLITAGGFEAPSEAMHLNKRIISIPIRKHYEQACNAMALQLIGVQVLHSLEELSKEIIEAEYSNYGCANYDFMATSPEKACLSAMTYWSKANSASVNFRDNIATELSGV